MSVCPRLISSGRKTFVTNTKKVTAKWGMLGTQFGTASATALSTGLEMGMARVKVTPRSQDADNVAQTGMAGCLQTRQPGCARTGGSYALHTVNRQESKSIACDCAQEERGQSHSPLVPACWAWTRLDPFSLLACGHLGGSATEMPGQCEHKISVKPREDPKCSQEGPECSPGALSAPQLPCYSWFSCWLLPDMSRSPRISQRDTLTELEQ